MHQLPQGWFTPATPGFNLVDEPWIMVQDRDGSFTETSLRGLAAGRSWAAWGDPPGRWSGWRARHDAHLSGALVERCILPQGRMWAWRR